MERVAVVIVGPTASGKTYLSLKLCELVPGEIISADSRQLYKYLDIGTAKPSKEELQKIKHHFIDYLEPADDYNISKYEIDALQKADELLKSGKYPIAVGGSGLYIKAFVEGIFNSVDTDEDYRSYLKSIKNEKGNEALYEILKEKDPVSADKMGPSNWKRVIRALEVLHLSGKPIWKHHQEQKRDSGFAFLQYGINWERKVLYSMIEDRVDLMIESGLVQEVEKLLSKGYTKELNSLNTVGYKEIISYLEGEISLSRAIELIKRNTRRYAKRQMTWFRRDEKIHWFDVESKNDLEKCAEYIQEDLKSFKR